MPPAQADRENQNWLPETLVINNNVKGDSGDGGICGMPSPTRKVLIAVTLYGLLATGLWLFFFQWSFSIPGLDKQIEKLEGQIDLLNLEIGNLGTEVGRLEGQVDRLGNETDKLEILNDNLRDATMDLNQTVTYLSELNPQLNESLAYQEQLTEALQSSLNEAEDLNEVLADSIEEYAVQISSMNDIQAELNETAQMLEEERENFDEIISNLGVEVNNLNNEVDDLHTQLEALKAQNELLASSNSNLTSTLTFLTQAGIDLNNTVEGISGYLAGEIDENTDIVLRDLELSYQNVYSYWTCSGLFQDKFGGKSWMDDQTLEVGSNDYPELAEYVDEYVLTEICADENDFELFLTTDTIIAYFGPAPPENISFAEFLSGVERYSTMMMEHYFDGGLSREDWSEAQFDCKNLPTEHLFRAVI